MFSSRPPPVSVKVCVLGGPAAGKSSLCRFICNGACASGDLATYTPTIGASFHTTTLGSTKLEIWDTSGDPQAQSLLRMYYRHAGVVLLVLPLDNLDQSMVVRAQALIDQIKHHDPNPGRLWVLCGSKADATDPAALQAAQDIAHANVDIGMKFYETSALDGDGIHEMVNLLAGVPTGESKTTGATGTDDDDDDDDDNNNNNNKNNKASAAAWPAASTASLRSTTMRDAFNPAHMPQALLADGATGNGTANSTGTAPHVSRFGGPGCAASAPHQTSSPPSNDLPGDDDGVNQPTADAAERVGDTVKITIHRVAQTLRQASDDVKRGAQKLGGRNSQDSTGVYGGESKEQELVALRKTNDDDDDDDTTTVAAAAAAAAGGGKTLVTASSHTYTYAGNIDDGVPVMNSTLAIPHHVFLHILNLVGGGTKVRVQGLANHTDRYRALEAKIRPKPSGNNGRHGNYLCSTQEQSQLRFRYCNIDWAAEQARSRLGAKAIGTIPEWSVQAQLKCYVSDFKLHSWKIACVAQVRAKVRRDSWDPSNQAWLHRRLPGIKPGVRVSRKIKRPNDLTPDLIGMIKEGYMTEDQARKMLGIGTLAMLASLQDGVEMGDGASESKEPPLPAVSPYQYPIKLGSHSSIVNQLRSRPSGSFRQSRSHDEIQPYDVHVTEIRDVSTLAALSGTCKQVRDKVAAFAWTPREQRAMRMLIDGLENTRKADERILKRVSVRILEKNKVIDMFSLGIRNPEPLRESGRRCCLLWMLLVTLATICAVYFAAELLEQMAVVQADVAVSRANNTEEAVFNAVAGVTTPAGMGWHSIFVFWSCVCGTMLCCACARPMRLNQCMYPLLCCDLTRGRMRDAPHKKEPLCTCRRLCACLTACRVLGPWPVFKLLCQRSTLAREHGTLSLVGQSYDRAGLGSMMFCIILLVLGLPVWGILLRADMYYSQSWSAEPDVSMSDGTFPLWPFFLFAFAFASAPFVGPVGMMYHEGGNREGLAFAMLGCSLGLGLFVVPFVLLVVFIDTGTSVFPDVLIPWFIGFAMVTVAFCCAIATEARRGSTQKKVEGCAIVTVFSCCIWLPVSAFIVGTQIYESTLESSWEHTPVVAGNVSNLTNPSATHDSLANISLVGSTRGIRLVQEDWTGYWFVVAGLITLPLCACWCGPTLLVLDS